jgi:hypothetical protein
MNDAFRAKVAAELGLDPGADDETVLRAAAELRSRSRIAAALGVATDADEGTLLKAARGLVEASRRRVGEVRLQAADRSAIDVAVAASDSPVADAHERAVLNSLGLPAAQVPAPVVLKRGVNPDQWTERQRQDFALR